MAKQAKLKWGDLLVKFDVSDYATRFRLSQLLIDALQFQNCKCG